MNDLKLSIKHNNINHIFTFKKGAMYKLDDKNIITVLSSNEVTLKHLKEYYQYIILINPNLSNNDWDGIYLKKELFLNSTNSKTETLIDVSPNSILADAYRKEKINSLLHALTAHQLMHIKMIFDNKSRTQISKELNIELTTVKKNLSRIYKLLNIKSRYQLVETYDKEYVESLLRKKIKH